MTDLDRDDWATLLAQLDDPPVGTVAEALADARDLDVLDAYDVVEEALAEDVLSETDTGGAFEAVRLAEEAVREEDDSRGETVETAGAPSYRELYLRAWANSDADQALVPHEDIAPVFRDAGYGDIIDHGGLPYSDWTVWTPDSREDPLYAYTPDLAGDTSAERERVAELLAEAGLGTERFIDVLDGQKASFDTGNAREPDDEEIGGNYGVKGGRAGDTERWLVDIDVDDYDEAKESNPRVEALRGETLGVASAHTTTDRPGHLYVAVDGDAAAIARDVLGREVDNPTASFGEIRVENQYVVGPGSEIVCGCELCEDPDTADHYGRYELATERPPVVWSPDEFRAFLEADPAIEPDSGGDADAGGASSGDSGRVGGSAGSVSLDDADARVTFAKAVDDHVADAFREATNPDDRSAADSRLARAVAPWVGYDEDDISDVLDDHGTSKWDNRGDSYRSSIVDYATDRTTDAYDPVPYWALVEAAVRDDLVDEDDLVARSSETGEVVDAEAADADTYRGLPSGTYNDVLQHVRDEYGVDPGREEVSGRDTDTEEWRDDPREVGATVDVRRAWDAAARVTPDEVEGLDAAADAPDRFACPATGEAVDVVRAVAVAEGIVDGPEEDLGDAYPEAYAAARDQYDAPLPEYLTTSDAVAEFDAVLDVIGEATFWDLNVDALATDVTEEGDEVDGDAVRALNPAWRVSKSEASVLVFPSGTVWDADSERVLDVVRFAALDAGIVRHPDDPLEGSDFVDAYTAARDRYGAPLPRWEPAADGAREVTPQLPPAEELLDARDLDGVDTDALDEARADVEELIGDVTADDGSPTVVSALPATGKTTGTVKTARERPLSYLAPRKELQAQALAKADRWGVDARVLPVFADEAVRDDVLAAGTEYVREGSKDRLRDRWTLVSRALEGAGEDGEDVDVEDIFVEEDEDEDEVDLDRATCPVADGDHGPAWALAVHIARRLGYTPREIHTEAAGLFGAPLPCSEDGKTCPYTEGWEHASDADDTADLLVGSYIHAHVESVRTAYSRNARGRVETAPRAVVLDEFVGEAFTREFGDLAPDHATWLARSLRDDIADQRDMYEADLAGDEWVRAWLEGRVDDVDAVDQVVGDLARMGELLDAREAAAEILDEVDADLLQALDALDPLETVANAGDAAAAFRDLTDALDALDPEQPGAGVEKWIRPTVVEPLARATVSGASNPNLGSVELGELPVAGDLRLLVEEAVEAVREGTEAAAARLNAATTALRGGREGCRRLAAWADDGYAHPDAHHLLAAVVDEDPRRIHTDSWAFDDRATDGTTLDVADTHGRATTVLDRNGHGALLHNPPARTDAGGDDVPLVGLDATGRAELWSVALGEEVSVADIHDSPADRAAFLEDALDLRVLRAADRPRYYSGSPASKDTNGDAALLEALADEYAGIDAPRRRDEEASVVGNPAAITTKGVREVLENDPRLDDVVDAWQHYGNLKGSNELGDQRLAAVLGCQHYGDDAIERFAALAGEEVDTDRRSGRGADLAYGSELADAYLQHMTGDQTMQAILRFARGDSGATVVARTSALREDLPVVGEAQVADTWSDTATAIARHYRTLGREFTTADVRDVVDVGPRQVRRVVSELADAGYVRRVEEGAGRATTYERVDEPGAGEVDLPSREAAVEPGSSATKEYYTWNVRVFGGDPGTQPDASAVEPSPRGAPPAPSMVDGVEPPS